MDCSCHLLPLIGRFSVRGAARLQKYAYLLSRQSYDDWVRTRHYHYSAKLTQDLRECMGNGLVSKTRADETPSYSLTPKGMGLLKEMKMAETDIRLEKLQTLDLETLLRLTLPDSGYC